MLLLLGSLFFYAWGEPTYILLILASVAINFCLGKMIEYEDSNEAARNFWFLLAIVYDLGALAAFKYTNFIFENIGQIFNINIPPADIVLPLGISFYTFQIMSYIIDLYRRKIKAENSILNLGVYLCMFPQLIAGPIVVYTQVAKELKERKINFDLIAEGLKTFILGLASKVLIANNIGALWEDLGQIGYGNISTPLAWLGILAFSIQIFFDFNGYSLMAIGLGKMLGFHFPINFNYPYISKSITEFWHRWHITLSSWMREYLYIPLGGNRKGKVRTYVNLFIVWTITGLWHGASWNFVIWGFYFFVLLSIERLFLKTWLDKSRVLSRVYAITAIMLGWMIFALTSFEDIFIYLKKLFSFDYSTDWIYYIQNYGIVFLLGILLSTPLLSSMYSKIKDRVAGCIILFLIFIASIAYLVDATYNPFLYFRF